MLGDARQEQCLAEAKRVLRAGGRLLLIDYAGPLAERRWSARHGPHGRFDLDRMRQPFIDMGMEQVRSGPLRWASLHFLTGMKG